MTLRRINSFATDKPDELSDQLERLQDNIASALAQLPQRLTWTDWVSSGTPQGAYDTITRVDTSVSAIAATLPSVSPETAGALVGFRRKGASNVTLEPVEATALIDGAASATLGADGLYLYVHDGTEWSRF